MHPNEWTKRLITRYFEKEHITAFVAIIDSDSVVLPGYYVFVEYFDHTTAQLVQMPCCRLEWDEEINNFQLSWMTSRHVWMPFGSYPHVEAALNATFSSSAVEFFYKKG